MPARSEAQRRLLNARFGHDWVKEHHFDNTGKLPERASQKQRKKRGKDNRREQLIRQFMRKHNGSAKR